MWILDNVASCRYCRFVEGLTGAKDINKSIQIGNGDSMKTTKIGNSKFEMNQLSGEKYTVTMNDFRYPPKLCFNLFSLNKESKFFLMSIMKLLLSSSYAKDGCVTRIMMKPTMHNNIDGFANSLIRNEKLMMSFICKSYLRIVVMKDSKND
jgi:hypothetical protein